MVGHLVVSPSFHQAPESLQQELRSAFETVQAQLQPPASEASKLESEFLAPSLSTVAPPSPSSPGKNMWDQSRRFFSFPLPISPPNKGFFPFFFRLVPGSGLISLDNLKEKRAEPKKSVGRPEVSGDSLTR